MIGAFAFIQRHLDKIQFCLEAGDQKMIEGIQPPRSPLDFIPQAGEAQFSLRQWLSKPGSERCEDARFRGLGSREEDHLRRRSHIITLIVIPVIDIGGPAPSIIQALI